MSTMPCLFLFLAAMTFRVHPAPSEGLTVCVSGKGDPVVLIPGLLGSEFGFRKVVPLLNRAGHKTIVIEPLGVGSSARPENADYSLTAQADRIAAVLDSLDPGPAIVVAHSVSASMAYRLGYRRPDLVLGIVSLDGGPAESATGDGLKRALTFAPIIKFFGGQGLLRNKIKGQLIDHSSDPSWVTEEVLDGYTRGARENPNATIDAYRRMSKAVEPEKLIPNLGRITSPVELLLSGIDHGGRMEASELNALRSRIPSFQMFTVPRAGHYIHEENPEAVVVAVARVGRRAQAMSRGAAAGH